jgi:hypothetical protein
MFLTGLRWRAVQACSYTLVSYSMAGLFPFPSTGLLKSLCWRAVQACSYTLVSETAKLAELQH